MFDRLKKAAQSAVQTANNLGAEYTRNQTLIEGWVMLPEAEMLDALREAVAPMDSRTYKGLTVVLGVLYMGAKAKVQQVAPEYASPVATTRPTELPVEPDVQRAVIRLRKLEMISSYGDAYRRNESPALPELAPIPVWTMETVKDQIDVILAEFEALVNEVGREAISQFTPTQRRLSALRDQFIAQGDQDKLRVHAMFMDSFHRLQMIYRPYVLPDQLKEWDTGLDMLKSSSALLSNDRDTDDPATEIIVQAEWQRVNDSLQELRLRLVRLPQDLRGNAWAVLIAGLYEEMTKLVFHAFSDENGDKSEDKQIYTNLLERCNSTGEAFAELPDEDSLWTLHCNTILPLAQEFRGFALRRHLTVINPIFSSSETKSLPNSVFYSGGPTVEALVNEACSLAELQRSATRGQANPVNDRWDQLRNASLAIFDFTLYSPALADPQSVDPADEMEVLGAAGPLAAVAYELGWAFVLGLPTVIIANEGQRVPFDVDVEAIRLDEGNDKANTALLTGAMLKAMYLPQRVSKDSAVAATIGYTKATFSEYTNPKVQKLVQSLNSSDYANNAQKLRYILDGLLKIIGDQSTILCTPVFPGNYPQDRRLFYVTGFRQWAESAQQATQQACVRNAVHYQIGYDRIEPDIIRVIWDDICKASHIVVDITNLNPNAVQELGIAHALGRKTMILTQNRNPHAYFPALSKVRTHYYDPNDAESMAGLGTLLDRFLTED